MVLKYIVAISFLFITMGNVTTALAKEPLFFSALQDVPLMDGLTDLEEFGVSFDKPEGRIIESFAVIDNLTEEQIVSFYQQSLPQFGWGRVSDNKFFRKNEFLEISFEEITDANNKIIIPIVKITIKPSL